MVEKRTLREWMAHLDAVDREYTMNEFLAVMVFNQREYTRIMLEMVRELKNSTEHTEAMLGAIDLLASQLAALNGLPYAASNEVRAALDRRRDEDRRQAALAARDGSEGA